MAGDQESAARQKPDAVAVSSGDSSVPLPKPPTDLDGATLPGVNAAAESKAKHSEITINYPSDVRSGSASGPLPPVFSNIGATIFNEGDILGGRYEILKILGMGGMGAVYKARDMEVDRFVALKVIRPELAGNAAILARFKQELILARQVTHRNIVRIYDLNEAGGVKFITMEYVEGEDLRSILVRQGKISSGEAVGIMLQVCAGLQAAHAEGVIHRDLKPSNIMRDPSGRIVIMDFGLARTIQGDGMTQTGMMIGTMEYMSPEQAMGKDLDARSDQFAVGLIFYELLSGRVPFVADSAIASLVKRTQESAVPLANVDANIPPELSAIVSKCLERDPAARFPTLQELVDELEIWQGQKPRTGQSALSRPAASRVTPAAAKRPFTKWIAIGIAVLVLAVGAVVGIRYAIRAGTSAVQGPVTSLAIIPFYNSSGDASLSWIGSSIAEALNTDIGRSSRLRMVSPDRLQQVLSDLRVSPQSQIDLQTVKNIAQFVHADTIIFGQYEKSGAQIRINATVADVKNDRTIPVNIDAANDQQLLNSLDKLAGDLREKLAANAEMLKELQSNSQHVTTKSVPALRAYDQGLQLKRSGDNTQALKMFEEATAQDPNFAMAFSKLAQTYAALGYDDKAYKASRQAMDLADNNNLSPRDRYLVQATHAGIMHDTGKAIAAYQELEKIDPDDSEIQFDLAKLYESASNYDQARKYLTRVLASDPNNIEALLASARVAMNSGDPKSALNPLDRARQLAMQFDNQEEKGKVYQAQGEAYQDLHSFDDALNSFQQALEIRKKTGDQRGIASSLGQIARVQDAMGNGKAALASYQEAIALDRQIGDKNGLTTNLMNLGSLYLDHGKFDEALKCTNEALQLARDAGDEMDQATLLMNLGVAHYSKSEYQDALTYFQQSYDISSRLNIQDKVALSLHNLAQTNFSLGQYDAAAGQYMKALDASRTANDKGGLASVSSDMGSLFAIQGRYDAALKAQLDAVNAFQQLNDRTFLTVYALAGYGDTLAAVGRTDEGRKFVNQALQLAADVKNDQATAMALNSLGDAYFFSGDYTNARQQYGKAMQLATKQQIPDQAVQAKLGLAKLDVIQGHGQSAAAALKKLKQDAESTGLKAQAVDASVYLGEALLAAGQTAAAQQELDNAVAHADKLGLRIQQAQAQYWLGKSLDRSGDTKDAVSHYREAAKILESLSKQDGAGRVLERADLKNVYQDAAKSYQNGGA
jgi:serine/threonine protein kinase/tetratricopeptide (TPR) repeat protein